MDSRVNFSYLIGKPFWDLARGPDSYDCWGVVIEVRCALGLHTPDYLYLKCSDAKQILEYVAEALPEFEKVTRPEPGDIVRFHEIGGHLHFGVMDTRMTFIHCGIGHGVKRDRIDSPIAKLIEGYYRWDK